MMKYKGYVAATEVDPDSGLIFGEVIGLSDVVTFQGRSVPEAIQAFHESVDLYLRTCDEQGLEPQRRYSGSIAVRTKPKVHGALVALARSRGLSLNELVDRVLTRHARRAGMVGTGQACPSDRLHEQEQGRDDRPIPDDPLPNRGSDR